MPVPAVIETLPAQSSTAVLVPSGKALEVIDLQGEQVADLCIFSAADPREYFSSGRTLDYNERIYLTTGALLYSNRSRPLVRIEQDDVARHDYLLTPCSERMFEILNGVSGHPSCHANLCLALKPFGIESDGIHATFNCFMNVAVSPEGAVTVLPPASRPGNRAVFRAMDDLIVGITACSSERTNNGRCKPIGYRLWSD
ncbi:MAG: urea carboxylase-associated family protein [Vulcanimicrobiaceae bacterium]